MRSAEKKGVKVVEADDDATVDAAYRLLVDVYRRARVPLVSPTMFAAARAELHARGMLRIVTAQLDERVVAARFLLLYKSRIVDWYAGSDRSFASYSPTEYLVWDGAAMGREHGYEVFDFGGAGRPDEPYGPREFKSKFGGELVGFGRDVLVHAPHRLRVSRAAYSAVRRLRRGAEDMTAQQLAPPPRHCMVVHAYYPLAETRVQREAEALVRAGYEVDVVCLRDAGERERERYRGVEIHRLECPGRQARTRAPVPELSCASAHVQPQGSRRCTAGIGIAACRSTTFPTSSSSARSVRSCSASR